jgi:putative ABC transport system permease protein
MLDDVRFALRLMARHKTFTVAVLLTLALGIGANTAIFSMVYGVLLRPLPYPTAARLMRVSEVHPGGTAVVRAPMLSNLTYYAWQESKTLEGLAAYRAQEFTMIRDGDAERVEGASVSPSLFAMLGTHAQIGRALREEDAARGASCSVVLSHTEWSERFGSDAAGIGDAITIDGSSCTIVGVMPAGFYFPDRDARFWTPYRIPRPGEDRDRPFGGFHAVGLIHPGVTAEQAAAEGTVAARSAGPRPMAADLILGKGGPVEVRVRPLVDEMTGRVRPALLVLLVSVALVLLIACANVTNLLLSRGVARRRELAVRAAIGAAHGRLARQLMTEALVLSVAGGAIGIGLGWALTRAVPALAPPDFPRLADIQMDGAALWFGCAASLVAGLLAGMLPALRLARVSPLADLRSGAGASTGRHARRLGANLLIAEAALAVMLLVAAGLLGRSFVRLLAVDPGYQTAGVLMARVHLPAGQNDTEGKAARAVLDRVRALPGVTTAGIGNMAPFAPMSAVIQVTLRGDSAEPLTARVRSYVVTPQYAETLSMPVREGRLFDERDLSSGIRPVIVNEEFVHAHLNDGRPVTGRRFTNPHWDFTVEIVGVVADVLKDGLDTAAQPEMYNLPKAPFGFPSFLNLVVRATGDPLAIVPAMRLAIRDAYPSAAVDDIETLRSRVSASVSEPRFAMAVLSAFATVAVALAAIGLYGVLSYQVSQRRREMGVRTALGASRTSIMRLVIGEGLAITIGGVVLGLLGAAWLSRLLQAMLFGITPHDALAFGVAPIALIVVAIVATLIPARRAATTDPIEALRAE